MTQGNQTWTNALLQGTKQPLFTFEISELGIILASFPVLPALVGGYGVTLYGVGGYGT